jgi:Protein of unknown function (DUF559)
VGDDRPDRADRGLGAARRDTATSQRHPHPSPARADRNDGPQPNPRRAPERSLPWAIRQADVHNLVDPETLRAAIATDGRRGAAALRRLLDREAFRLTDSELERLFLPLAAEAGLVLPETGARPRGYKADFFWRALGLIVETDSLRYHRTTTQQLQDRRRDQAHAAAGLTTLRFTHWQISNEPQHVVETLSAVAARLYP